MTSTTLHEQRTARRPSSMWRSRWAAIGAAVAVTLGAGGIGLVAATASEPSSFVAITPERILDTRVGIGLEGRFVSPNGRDLQVTGSVPVAPSGTSTVVPPGATAVTLNVTALEPQAAGFISVRPAGTPGPPQTSNLNFDAGDVIPNSVTVALSAGGAIEITYDALGVAGPESEVLVDVVGYFVEGAGAPGPQGPEGPEGPQGPAGPGALWGRVHTTGTGATLLPGAVGIESVQRNEVGVYRVRFSQSVAECARFVSVSGHGTGAAGGTAQGYATVANPFVPLAPGAPPTDVIVRVYDEDGDPSDGFTGAVLLSPTDGFDIMVICQ